jgi:hypothetical protein
MIAALSRSLDPDAPDAPISRARFDQLRRGDDRMAFAGTSMAAAVAAGVIALGRATDGSRRDDRALLAASAVSPTGLVSAAFDARVGAGLIDAPGYVSLRVSDEPTASYEVGCTRTHTAPAADDVQVVVRARRTTDARVRTRAAGAPFSGTRTMRDGFVAVPVTLPTAPLGALLAIEAEIDGVLVPACTLELSDPAQTVGVGVHCALARARGRSDPGSVASLAGLGVLAIGVKRRSRARRTRRR